MHPIAKKVFAGKINPNQKETCPGCHRDWNPMLEDHECDKGLSELEEVREEVLRLRKEIEEKLDKLTEKLLKKVAWSKNQT